MQRGLAAVLALVACGAVPGAVLADGLPPANPAEVGLASDRLDRLTRAMEQDIETGRRVGAVVAISRKGKTVYSKGFGLADRETGRKVLPSTIFRIHSQTKPIVSAGLLMLMEEGYFSLNDPLAKHIPELGSGLIAAARR